MVADDVMKKRINIHLEEKVQVSLFLCFSEYASIMH